MAPRWSTEEESALRVAVDIHGIGRWKNIWNDPQFNNYFTLRTSEEDLREKWRRIVRANQDTAAALLNAYHFLGIDPPAVGDDPPPHAPVVDDPPAEDVDDDEDEGLEVADEKFEANFGKSRNSKNSFRTAFFYTRGVWCKYKEETQALLRVAFEDDIPYVKEKVSGNREKLIDIYRMTELSLWKVGPKARPMAWMDRFGEMHYPAHLDSNEFTVVLKDGEETFVFIPKMIAAINHMDLEGLDPEMSEIASTVLDEYYELYEEKKGAFVKNLGTYASRDFLTLVGSLV